MNKEKEILLQLLLEKYAPNATTYEKPKIVRNIRQRPRYRWTKHEVNTLRILHFERGHSTAEIARVMRIPSDVVSRKLYKLKKEMVAA
jgi:hypothetical protein